MALIGDGIIKGRIVKMNERRGFKGFQIGKKWFNLSRRPSHVDPDLREGDEVEAQLDPENAKYIMVLKRASPEASAAAAAPGNAPAEPAAPSVNDVPPQGDPQAEEQPSEGGENPSNPATQPSTQVPTPNEALQEEEPGLVEPEGETDAEQGVPKRETPVPTTAPAVGEPVPSVRPPSNQPRTKVTMADRGTALQAAVDSYRNHTGVPTDEMILRRASTFMNALIYGFIPTIKWMKQKQQRGQGGAQGGSFTTPAQS